MAGLFFAPLLPPSMAQRLRRPPATDSAAQASPLTPVLRTPADDTSAQASPIPAGRSGGPYIAPHTAIPIALSENIDSGKLTQGQDVHAQLTGPVAVHGGPTLPAGTPVVLSVIASVPAGRIAAQGEFSLQLLHVGKLSVYTDTLVFEGKPGHQDLPDSAPALGTDAGLPSGAPLTFHVQPPPAFAENQPQDQENGPGSVTGVAVGSSPPGSALKPSYGDPNKAGSGNTPAQQQPSVSSGSATTNQATPSPAQTVPSAKRPQ